MYMCICVYMYICIYVYMYICKYVYKYTYTNNYKYMYINIPATSTCAIFCLLAKSTKFQPLKIKNAPGRFLEQEKCPWKIIPESYLSSCYIPSCDSNATTVGDCLCLLLAPNQRLKSVHDMPVWDEQVARMVWKRAKLLKTRKPMKPKAGEVGGMVLVSRNSEPDLSIWLCALRAPMFCHSYDTWKTSNGEIENEWFHNYGKLRLFPGKLRLLPGKLRLLRP